MRPTNGLKHASERASQLTSFFVAGAAMIGASMWVQGKVTDTASEAVKAVVRAEADSLRKQIFEAKEVSAESTAALRLEFVLLAAEIRSATYTKPEIDQMRVDGYRRQDSLFLQSLRRRPR